MKRKRLWVLLLTIVLLLPTLVSILQSKHKRSLAEKNPTLACQTPEVDYFPLDNWLLGEDLDEWLASDEQKKARAAGAHCTAEVSVAAGDVSGAVRLIKQGQEAEAIHELESILAREPRNQGALLELAMLYQFDRGEPAKALPYLEKAYETNLKSDFLLGELAGLYVQLGRMNDAVLFLERLTTDHPDEPGPAFGLGKILAANDANKEAIPYLEHAVASGAYDFARPDLGFAYSQASFKEKARATLKEVILYDQESYRKGDYQGKELAAKFDLAVSYLNYASELFLQGETDKARDIFETKVMKIRELPFSELPTVF